ncbi:hypothetical protein [uncultured Selenomonas sp.]|uniref:hypothetical protein n=1 Tax=uncultured Selenomonas sp. TaxID=159275 RepID=UPI0028D6305C|nr:hypothetical protein [uncultured Selenomonas sp.]
MRQRVWSFVAALCAALCVALGASAGTASAQAFPLVVAQYTIAGEDGGADIHYNVIIHHEERQVFHEGLTTSYYVPAELEIYPSGGKRSVMQGVYGFAHSNITGAWRGMFIEKNEKGVYDFDFDDAHLVPVEQASRTGVCFKTGPNETARTLVKKFGARKYNSIAYVGSAAYVLNVLYALDKGNKVPPMVDEGTLR